MCYNRHNFGAVGVDLCALWMSFFVETENNLLALFTSPIGPALLLLVGAVLQLLIGRRVRRPDWLTGIALFFVLFAPNRIFVEFA